MCLLADKNLISNALYDSFVTTCLHLIYAAYGEAVPRPAVRHPYTEWGIVQKNVIQLFTNRGAEYTKMSHIAGLWYVLN